MRAQVYTNMMMMIRRESLTFHTTTAIIINIKWEIEFLAFSFLKVNGAMKTRVKRHKVRNKQKKQRQPSIFHRQKGVEKRRREREKEKR
jgi:hypothetical protein